MVLGGFKPWLRNIIVGGLLLVNVFFQQQLISDWAEADKILDALVSTFPSDEGERTLILNLPDNHEGVPMLRDYSDKNPMTDYFSVHGKKLPDMDYVVQYKIGEFGQQFSASYDGGQGIELRMAEWGSWWMRDGQGIVKDSTSQYTMSCRERTMKVALKNPSYYDRILYTDGKQWQRLD